MLLLICKSTNKLFTPRTLEKKPRHFRVSPLSYSRVDLPWHQPSVTQPRSQVTSRQANQRSSFEFSSFEFVKLISYSQHISALVFAFQSCSAQFVAMSGRTLQFLRYRKEKVDLRSLFIAVSFRSVPDSDVTRKSESMTVGVMAGQLGNMAEEKLRNVVAFSPVLGEWMFFWSVCRSEEASGLLLVSSWTNRRAWLDFMAESVWCVFPVNQDGFLPSISSTSPHLLLPRTRSIMLETAQDSTWSNRRRHCTSK